MSIMAEWLRQPESKTLEFKRDLSSPRPWLKTLVAFANSAGGRLIFGITDDRQVIGIEHPLDEEERLCNLIADAIAPRLVPNIELATVDGKTLLIVEVFLSGSRPHFIKAEGIEAGAYVRLGSTSRQADAQLVAELQRGIAGVSFDALPMPHLSLDDLDVKAIRKDFADKRTVNEQMLQSLRILAKDQNRLVPSHGGVLLYGLERRQHFDDAWVQCGRFIGDDKADIFDQFDIEEPLPRAVDEIMLFLKKHAMRGADFSAIRRKDRWSIPVDILREVVINALVHADYSHRGTPIRIAFFDDRIEVESPGLLLPGLTVEDMKRGVSQIRNPVIARVFKELALVEQWGSGIPGIFRRVRMEKLPEPTIEELAGRLRFTVPLPKMLPLTREQSRKGSSPQVGLAAGGQVGTKSGPSRDQVETLSHCQTAQAITELMDLAGRTNRTKFRDQVLKPLLDAGWLEMTIPDKPTSSKQKYRITDKGRSAVAASDGEMGNHDEHE